MHYLLIISQTTNFRLSQIERVADHNVKLHENYGVKFPKIIQNTVGKGEIACYKQFLLFPQRFQNTYTADT